MSSKCKQCGEPISKTGNYTVRILPAKRIPKKAKKLMERGEIGGESGAGGMTKFQKFLAKRSTPANFMELTCGKCGGVSKIKMVKTWCGMNQTDQLEADRKKEQELTYKSGLSLGSEKTKKRRDKSAGLTLPVMASTSKEPTTPTIDSHSKKQGKPISNAQRKRELENINRMLFKSKKAKKSGSTLHDFLSSI